MKTSAQEECGVWLDTVQLKGKAKQKRLARPISKMLNPLAEGGGYSLAVALNFTQTKMEMPKTKQSSISTFFTSQRRVLNKMSTCEVPKFDLVQTSSSSPSTSPTHLASGTKRRRDTEYVYKSNTSVDHEWKSQNMMKPHAEVRQEQVVTNQTPSQYVNFESEEQFEFIPPQSKRRITDSRSLAAASQPLPQAWSQDPLLTSSQYTDSDFYLTNKKDTTEKNSNDSEECFLNSFQSEEAFGHQVDLEGKTSTQKSYKLFHSSHNDKENSRVLFTNSPTMHSSISQLKPLLIHKWTEPKSASPQKNLTSKPWKRGDKKESHNSHLKWAKPRSSPLKKQAHEEQSREVDEDNLGMLFTQDSEGFRVISHRGLQTRSPLKNQTNANTDIVRRSVYRCLVEEDKEDEMLFTQDSQGNRVIKH